MKSRIASRAKPRIIRHERSPLLCHSILLPLGVISLVISPGSHFFCFPIPHLSPFERSGWDVLARIKNPSSARCQLCLWPYCSGFMFDSNPTVYPAKPNGSATCQKPQLFLSPIKAFPASIPAPAAHGDAGPSGGGRDVPGVSHATLSPGLSLKEKDLLLTVSSCNT